MSEGVNQDAEPRRALTFMQLVERCRGAVDELLPWDLCERLEQDGPAPLLLDVREPYEFAAMHIDGSINVPRGVLESAAEYGYEETMPELVRAREREVVVICRSGYRSLLAGKVLRDMGYARVLSLCTGLRGWNDYEQPMVDADGRTVDLDQADAYFTPRISDEQLGRGGPELLQAQQDRS